MPIIIPKTLPAYDVLEKEKVFVMTKERAEQQDIRAIKIAIVNLMPIKETTETQLMRMLSNTALQIEITLLAMETHRSKTTSEKHLSSFYGSLSDIKAKRFDGMIITGAPIETLPFEEVDYFDELKDIMEYSKSNVFSSLHLCWGSQAGLYYHYGIKKKPLKKKLFGVYEHKVIDQSTMLTKGLDKMLSIPHSRWTGFSDAELRSHKELNVLIKSKDAGAHLIEAKGGRQIFAQGHWEYDIGTLKHEYERDFRRGIDVGLPENYFAGDDPNGKIIANWRGNGNMFFVNWLNFVYQETPFNLSELERL